MIIDTHCHIDLYNKPKELLNECEREGITVLAMTNLPSHFEIGIPYFRSTKNIRLALGLHPLFAERHKAEFPKFIRNIDKTSYIGEIGLDFSNEGIKTKKIQLDSFTKVLENISNKKKILSIHSKRAEKEVLELLVMYNIKNAIFHWYSGPKSLINKIVEAGYFFSINPSMTSSKNGKTIISNIPVNRILTESDGPYVQYKNRIIQPRDVKAVSEYLSELYRISISDIENHIQSNFNELISKIR